jgi:hypothetical protein
MDIDKEKDGQSTRMVCHPQRFVLPQERFPGVSKKELSLHLHEGL